MKDSHMGFDLDSETRRQLGHRLIDRIDEYLSGLPSRPVQLPLDQRTFGDLQNQMPEAGQDAAIFLDHITTRLIDEGCVLPCFRHLVLKIAEGALVERKLNRPARKAGEIFVNAVDQPVAELAARFGI